MISILTQERLLGATLGVVLTGAVVLEQRRNIYSSISNVQSQSQGPSCKLPPVLVSDVSVTLCQNGW
ncbi:Zinc finger, C3HC4 type family protein, putative [Arachis hypogaea]|nr:Zinc finger, C3HC4 type family protein, putative [Arachis hypogaea]